MAAGCAHHSARLAWRFFGVKPAFAPVGGRWSSVRHPKSAAAYHSRGLAYEALGNPNKALADFSAAVKADPSFEPAWAKRARTLTRLNRFQEAIADYSKAIALNPDNPLSYHNRGICYQNIGKRAESAADLGRAKQLEATAKE